MVLVCSNGYLSKGKNWLHQWKCKKLKENDPTYHTWDAQNFMAMIWLVNSMVLGNLTSIMQTTMELWDALNRSYSDVENSAIMFELRNKARNLKQGDLDVTEYFNALPRLCNELDLSSNEEWSCLDDATKY